MMDTFDFDTPIEQPECRCVKRRAGRMISAVTVWVIAAALVVSLVAGACLVTAATMNRFWTNKIELMSLSYDEQIRLLNEQLNRRPTITPGDIPSQSADGYLTPAQVYAMNANSVVTIQAKSGTGVSSGSGFVRNDQGYVVTNYHVVDGASTFWVVASDGKQYTADFVGGDASNDIAVLKIQGGVLPAAVVGSSDALNVGDQVAALGNPLGELSHSLTVGYVSAKDRLVTADGSQINMMQIDAAINSGNSGGPLFNMKGEVVGITAAKYSGTSSSGASIEGIGFAIPMDDVIGMIDDLIQYGYVTGGYLGVMVSNVNLEAAELYGLPLGVLVHEVTSGGSAEAAGVLPQDIIVNVGGHPISNMNDLTRALRCFTGGDRVTVTVYRHTQGGEVKLIAVLGYKPAK